MALTSVEANNKLVLFLKELTREYIRENRFSPYMGKGMNSIIRLLHEPKSGGEQINVPIVTKLTNAGKSTGTLVDAEESIDNYGCRFWIDWARNAVAINKAQQHKSSVDLFGVAKPMLSEWGRELQRDEIIAACMALPSEAAPAGLGSDTGQRVNGVLYEDSTAGQRNTWAANNSDRVLYGNALGNFSGTHATDLAKIDVTDDTFTRTSIKLLKRIAATSRPKIKPYKVDDGRGSEAFACFAGTTNFEQMAASLESLNSSSRPREDRWKDNPLFSSGDLLYENVIVREVPEIDDFVDNIWADMTTAGNGTTRVAPVFFCGQSALAMPWGQMPIDTTRKEDDYGFIKGRGVEMAYGAGKIFKRHASTKLVQWGMVSAFFSAVKPA
jgi:Protein of unknown function (DUF4043)